MSRLVRIVSGGQTGVDRAALDAAIALGLPHGGWCPAGRRAEDGPISRKYLLRETRSPKYGVRTRRNVRDSDGTLILHRGELSGGTELTRRIAIELNRPLLIIDLDAPPELELVRRWIEEQEIRVLNVAGPRESSSPGIGQSAFSFLSGLLSP